MLLGAGAGREGGSGEGKCICYTCPVSCRNCLPGCMPGTELLSSTLLVHGSYHGSELLLERREASVPHSLIPFWSSEWDTSDIRQHEVRDSQFNVEGIQATEGNFLRTNFWAGISHHHLPQTTCHGEAMLL